MTPRFLPPKPISESTLREVDARLDRRIRELEAQVHRLAEQVAALHLGSTCHPDWVNPGKGSVAAARRASVVEAVLAAAGPRGMNLPELSAYLHIPMGRRDTVFADLSYLIAEERAERVPTRAKRWRIKEK
jgi:hypothetical protein